MNRRIAIGALCTLLAVVSISHAQPPPPRDMPVAEAPWYQRWFGIGPDKPKPPPVAEHRDPTAEALAQRAAAEADWDRRLQVCDELRQIAIEKNDQKLAAKADELERRATELYKRQTAHLAASRMVPSSDRMDKALGSSASSTAAANRLNDSSQPDVGRTGQANAFREVKP
jgi:hypothetical protein